MDIRRDGFFATLSVNGRLIELQLQRGAIMSLVGEALKALTSERSRLTADGDLEIMLRIRNKPFDTSKNGALILGKAEELAALLDTQHGEDMPAPNESYEEYYARLIAGDYTTAAAEYIAAQWFDREVNPTTTLWLNDPKAIRFRVLNSRDEEFEAALPSEYDALKHYVQTTYPEFLEGLVFRTA